MYKCGQFKPPSRNQSVVILTILEVHTKVQKINLARTDVVNKRNQIFVRHFIWDILDHNRSSSILTIFDSCDIQLVAFMYHRRISCGRRRGYNTTSPATTARGSAGSRMIESKQRATQTRTDASSISASVYRYQRGLQQLRYGNDLYHCKASCRTVWSSFPPHYSRQ